MSTSGQESMFDEEQMDKIVIIMFDLFLINFGYVCGSYKTLDHIKMGKKTGFQFSV